MSVGTPNQDDRTTSAFAFLLIAIAAICSAGCGSVDRSCPVTGQLVVNGQTAVGAYVLLQPLSPGATENPDGPPTSPASARTDEEGRFALMVPAPGQYTVNVFWPKVHITPEEEVEGEDRFRGRFRDPGKPVTTVSIIDGSNTLPPIELKFPSSLD